MSFDFLLDEINKQQDAVKSSDVTAEAETVIKDAASDIPTQTESPEENNITSVEANARLNKIDEIMAKEDADDFLIDIDEIYSEKPDYPKLSQKCNFYIHHILQKWSQTDYEQSLLQETKRNLFVVLVKLRKAILTNEMLISLSTIFYYLQQDPMKTNEAFQSYMTMSIGNVAWPIGVTQIGIHSRSAQSRLQNGQCANIMIDEPTRLWITSVKRLLTFQEWHHKAQLQL